MDGVFKALADASRRELLDRLRGTNGQTVSELCARLDISRQAVSKHLDILEEANLVVTIWQGREKLHYLNPVPIHEISERWINKFDRPHMQKLGQLKQALEAKMTKPEFVYAIYIASTPEKVFAALTDSKATSQFWFGNEVKSDWKAGSPLTFHREGKLIVEGKVLECDPPHRLSYTFRSMHEPHNGKERPSRVTLEIEPQKDQVKLTVMHDDFDEGSKVFESISNGWPLVLSSLKSLLEAGHVLRAPWYEKDVAA